MKKMLKIFSLIIVLLLVVGCGKNSNEEKESIKEENVVEGEKEQEETKIISSNLGYFVKYGDDIYYWKITNDSRKETGITANFYDIVGSNNELIKLSSNGKEETVYKGKGSKEIVISNNKIYTSYASKDYENERTIYNIDLKGNNEKEICKGNIIYIVNDKIYGKYNNGIFYIDTKTDECIEVKPKSKLIVQNNDTLYYMTDYSKESVSIGTIKDGKDDGILVTFKSSDFEGDITFLNVEGIEFDKDDVIAYIGYRNGTGNFLQELNKYRVSNDGSTKKEKVFTIEETYDFPYIEFYTNGKAILYDEKPIIDYELLKKDYNLEKNDETLFEIYGYSIIDNDIYFVLDYGTHYSAEDMGWRYSYKRGKTIYFKYNIDSKKLDKLYEF